MIHNERTTTKFYPRLHLHQPPQKKETTRDFFLLRLNQLNQFLTGKEHDLTSKASPSKFLSGDPVSILRSRSIRQGHSRWWTVASRRHGCREPSFRERTPHKCVEPCHARYTGRCTRINESIFIRAGPQFPRTNFSRNRTYCNRDIGEAMG